LNSRAIPNENEMLREWGERLWTFPEVLLSPAGKNIDIYTYNEGVTHQQISKLHFAAKAWPDSATARQLVDHFESTLSLSRLELVTLAMEALHKRKTGRYLAGDHSYALMGLLRLRKSDPTDSAFQAFARLSLLNDSDKLLERLVCMLPKDPRASWSAMTDKYGARLWDIEPNIQISGIGDDDTVIVDGARATNVQWESFALVYNERHASLLRMVARFLLQGSGVGFIGAAIGLSQAAQARTAASGFGNTPPLDAGTIVAILSVAYFAIVILMSPWLLRVIYGGKFWKTQAWMFAFEGYLPIHEIEKNMFGTRKLNRLQWSAFGSPLSHHQSNKHGECVGLDPTTRPEVLDLVRRSDNVPYGQLKVCTCCGL
jgi:hypothetical protein